MFILQLKNSRQGEWFEIDALGNLAARQPIDDLSLCPKINADDNLVVLLPGENILTTSVTVPKMRQSELIHAIPFALEEQLACDPDNVTIAIGETLPSKALCVAIMNKVDFDNTMQSLSANGLSPRAVLPDFLGIPWEKDTWSVVVQNHRALIRTDFQKGFSIDSENMVLFLQTALNQAAENLPKKIYCWQENDVIDVALFENLSVPFEIQNAAARFYLDIKSLSTKPVINLLQGKYKSKTRSTQSQRNWMVCGFSIALFVFILFFGKVAQWIYYRHESTALNTQVMSVYQTIFPGAKTVLEPRFRVTKLLSELKLASHSDLFLRLLSVSGQLLVQHPVVKLQSIGFDNQQLQLIVKSAQLPPITDYFQALQNSDLTVLQQVTQNKKNDVVVQISIAERA